MYEIGSYVYDLVENTEVQILDLSNIWGYISYKVLNLESGQIYIVDENSLCTGEKIEKINDNFIKYVSLLAKIKNETAQSIVTQLSDKIIPLPHQKYALKRAVYSNDIRYILADEVGLGKTIEAGLIIKELKVRGLIKRILVVCPTGLVTQWHEEMKSKFNENFHVILPEAYETIRKITDNDDIYGNFEQVISPMDSIKPIESRVGWDEDKVKKYNKDRIQSVVNSGWDLIIIDEAHRIAGSSGEVARHKLGKKLAGASPYLLLLTATPHNGKTDPFLRLVRLLDKNAFPNTKAIVKEQVAPYVIRTEKREAIDNNGNKLFKDRITKVIKLTWDERHSMQRELYNLVTNYVSKVYNLSKRHRGKNVWVIFLLIIMQRLVTSSTRSIRESMERRLEILNKQSFEFKKLTQEEFVQLDLEGNLNDVISSISLDIEEEKIELNRMISVAKQAEFQYLDIKIEPLLEIVDELFTEKRDRKVIIFTEFIATQEYLRDLLSSKGYKISILNGSKSIDDRNELLNEFKTKTDILISTDAGGEGLNLQFSSCVINYDLPWNPMKIEQRIGRVDRIGQSEDVTVYNFVLTDTVENRVKDVLEKKLSVILKEVGIDKYSDVLDSESANINFTEAYLKSIGNPGNLEYYIEPVEEDLKKQVKNNLNIKQLITQEKDLEYLAHDKNILDLEKLLKLLITYYENSLENSVMPIENYNLESPEIKKHLNKVFLFNKDENVADVEIVDFPNEKGYFMIWKLSVTVDMQNAIYLPVFINEEGVLRPIAGEKIWKVLISPSQRLNVFKGNKISTEKIKELELKAQDFAYENFIVMKDEYIKRQEEIHRKFVYALNLRQDAAEKIGIENIRKKRISNLIEEKEHEQQLYKERLRICPEFKLIMMIHLL